MNKVKADWRVKDQGSFVEVVPIRDLRAHLLGDECWCNPKVEQDDDMRAPMISHNALDERE